VCVCVVCVCVWCVWCVWGVCVCVCGVCVCVCGVCVISSGGMINEKRPETLGEILTVNKPIANPGTSPVRSTSVNRYTTTNPCWPRMPGLGCPPFYGPVSENTASQTEHRSLLLNSHKYIKLRIFVQRCSSGTGYQLLI